MVIPHLAKCLHSLDEDQVDNDPGHHQGQNNVALQTAHVMQAVSDIQHMITVDSEEIWITVCTWEKVDLLTPWLLISY